jgi:hypothetical protein
MGLAPPSCGPPQHNPRGHPGPVMVVTLRAAAEAPRGTLAAGSGAVPALSRRSPRACRVRCCMMGSGPPRGPV